MIDLVHRLEDRIELSDADVRTAVELLLEAGTDPGAKSAFLLALRQKGETASEMAAFVDALLAHAVEPGLDPAQLPLPIMDICGTGGDRMELFNVSTTSMFVLAAGGAVVVKHGNRAITSKCGGADVLEALGVRIDLPPADLRRCVETLGLGFIFAPAYHPAFRVIAPIRRALAERGIPTIFNLLGPLLNPARPALQLVGVFRDDLLTKYAASLSALGRKCAWAVHGDGLDELSISGKTRVVEVRTGREPISWVLDSEDLGIARAPLEALKGGDRATNTAILSGILDGSIRGPMRDLVALNAAAGFVVAGLARDLAEGLLRAEEQIQSGRALAKLRALQGFK